MPAPQHVAIIMDGNGRWANRRGMPRAAGHHAGARAAREVVETAAAEGVFTLTLFAFSSENWNRPRTEVRVLMDLLRRTIRRESRDLHANNVRMSFVGDRTRFSPALRDDLQAAEYKTADNTGLRLIVAVDYGGRWDVVQAARRLACAHVDGEVDADSLDEAHFARYLSFHAYGEPDLFIRTGGERRISNFLLWDLAYSELYFCDELWPDFGANGLRAAMGWFADRDRRFGRLPSASG